MKSNYKTNPATLAELDAWILNPLINPRNKRPISKNGSIYKYFESIKNKENRIIDIVDDRDPISMSIYWQLNNKQEKVSVYDDINKLRFYRDSKGLLRSFEIESIKLMKKWSCVNHPITGEPLPESLFNNLDLSNDEENEITIDKYALEVFQLFSNISIFIDHNWFLSLNKAQLLKFAYEVGELYKQNLSDNLRNNICPEPLFNKTNYELNILNQENIQKYLLDQMKLLLETKVEEAKYMINYILVGGLGIVIPQIKELYPDFQLDF